MNVVTMRYAVTWCIILRFSS